MRLENRLPDEGINSSTEHPLKELAWLLGGAIAAVVAVVFAVSLAAHWLAPRVPYAVEARLAAGLPSFAPVPESERGRAVQRELRALAERLSRHLELPEGMTPRIGYADTATVNAFATLGGQVTFYRGLLEKLDSEEALAMVMAHELAHLSRRDPLAAFGRGIAVALLLSVLGVDLSSGGLLDHAGLAASLSFSRDQERDADRLALAVLQREYGHVGGALDLFDAFLRLPTGPAGMAPVEFLHTHPLTGSRVEAARAWASANGASIDAPRRPLPPALAALRAAARAKPTEASPAGSR